MKIVHAIAVSLFVLSLLIKIWMIVTDRKGLLEWYRGNLKFMDMGLTVAFLATGLYLWSEWNFLFSLSWFTTKFIAIMIGIPLGIVALRKESKPLSIAAGVLFVYILWISFEKNPIFF
jgi:uncharacterized membrane protein SirB2